ncbi:hypothetical protein LSAT2_012680 [Lamellibrachia satsuma]|nr:hypothetical protein LSAT2_012680 [Lamellibrachia satsuma]
MTGEELRFVRKLGAELPEGVELTLTNLQHMQEVERLLCGRDTEKNVLAFLGTIGRGNHKRHCPPHYVTRAVHSPGQAGELDGEGHQKSIFWCQDPATNYTNYRSRTVKLVLSTH